MYFSIITDLKKIGNSYFYKNPSFHGSVLDQVNLLIFSDLKPG